MGTYRVSRNFEASIIDFIRTELTSGGWTDINTELGFPVDYNFEVPHIAIKLSDTTHDHVEIGDNATTRTPLIFIDIFGSSDGNRLDLKDFLISVLKDGIPYFQYTTTKQVIDSKVASGRIRVINFEDTPVDLGVNKSELDPRDRYRHLLTLTTTLDQVEA